MSPGVVALLFSVWMCAKVGCVAMAMILELAYPHKLGLMMEAYQLHSRRCSFIGAVNMVLGTLLAFMLINIEILAIFGLALLAILFACAGVGYSLAYRDVGQRIADPHTAASPLRRIFFGGVLTEAACVTPVLGQIFSLAILFRGAGAVVLTLLRREKVPTATPAMAGEEP